MSAKLKLIGKAITFQVSPKVLIWGLLNMCHRSLGTGNRRYEFERLYLENPDPWKYASSAYEQQKYERSLACALKWRSGSRGILELGCSVGVFSAMLAMCFDTVTAVDVSREALRAAVAYNRHNRNIRFVQGNLESLTLNHEYDVICCAEVLNYINERNAEKVFRQLDQHLAGDGIVLFVTGMSDGWEDILAERFKRVFAESVPDPLRPYRIAVFSR